MRTNYWQKGRIAPNNSRPDGQSGCEPVLTRAEAVTLAASHLLQWVRSQQRAFGDPSTSDTPGWDSSNNDNGAAWRRGYAAALEQILKSKGSAGS